MPKFLIQRDIPGAEKLSPADLQAIATKSNGVLHELNMEGHDIQWVDGRITCVYIAPNEQVVREHAMRGEFPADAVRQVTTMIDPMTAENPA